MAAFELHLADCRDVVRGLPENSVDSVVTDPPYGLGFMGKGWDRGVPGVEFWAPALRALKPGGHLLAFSGTRTYHRMVCAIEDAGFEIRDQIGWAFGSGFPKSHNGPWGGTALKPAWEPIVLARKPLTGTVEANWREWGTGALNIDGCRVALPAGEVIGLPQSNPHNRVGAVGATAFVTQRDVAAMHAAQAASVERTNALGRWPANLIHDGSDEVLAAFPHAPGQMAKASTSDTQRAGQNTYGAMTRGSTGQLPRGDTGSAARFFYCAKASRQDRNEGCEHMERRPLYWSSGTQNPGSFQSEGTDKTSQNNHPTVKPTALMAYLCRLVTPPGGTVLDPFMGSGSTGKAAVREGFNFIGCETDDDYFEIAKARIAHAAPAGAHTWVFL